GTDTGGSIRIPAAFCGVSGMKTTHGRVPVGGVYPLAPSLDTVGPMARGIDGIVRAMALLEPGFSPADRPARTVGRLRIPGLSSNPEIEIAVDEALAAAHHLVIDITIDAWTGVYAHALNLLRFEAATVNRPILDDPVRRALLGNTVRDRFGVAEAVGFDQVVVAREVRADWSTELESIFARVEVLALPSVPWFPSTIDDPEARSWNTLTLPINFAGNPAIALPIRGGRIPPSLQLVGPRHSEELLVTTAREIEEVAGRTWADT
ncbi:MAG TPA: amidase, partial [Acidimicrobiales bacterium]|nr:amidase [Acidimicrobiales bacterium]